MPISKTNTTWGSFLMTSPRYDWAEELIASSGPARVQARLSYVYDLTGQEPESSISVSLVGAQDGVEIIAWAGLADLEEARRIGIKAVEELHADHLAEAADPINQRPRVPGLLS